MSLIAGKYEILEELGQGSTGAVYLVRHTDLGLEYALKLLSREFSSDERFISRFRREAKIMQAFVHPGSAVLRDFGRTFDGLYYMTMDYCGGRSLKDHLEELTRLTPSQAIEISAQILEVLGSAHKVGIIHRDVKPENVILAPLKDGTYQARILDFGIAKVLQDWEPVGRLTMEGTAVGTPWYMSPEQAAGEMKLDHRVDLYSVGVMLYELLSGELPFKGQTVLQTLLLHLTQPPPPWSPELGIPFRLEQIVKKSLRKEPGDRYQSAEDFRQELLSSLTDNDCEIPIERSQDLALLKETEAPLPEVFITPDLSTTEHEQTKVLCLDDNPMILDIISHILNKEGYTVFTATDSSAIHPYLFQERVSLLVTDVKMPGIEGWEVCQMLKQTMRSLKIVLFSNLPDRELECLARESEADGWISKNSKPEEWIKRIQMVLEETH